MQPTLEPITSESMALVCATLNLDSSVLDLGMTCCDIDKRQENVVKTRVAAPEELAVREAANQRLEAVLREHGVHLPPSNMFPILIRVRHFLLQVRSLGLPDEKVHYLACELKKKKHSRLS